MELSKDDGGIAVSSLALSKVGLGPRPGTKEDNFCTPHNEAFYSKYEYCSLDRERPRIRLLKVYPEEKTLAQHMADNPTWKASGLDSAPISSSSSHPFSSRNPLASQDVSIGDKLLACDMVDGVRLSQFTGRYLTLSYAAGDHRNTARILVGGYIFNAFAQLIHALKCAVRYWYRETGYRGECLLFWVDQICINQSDAAERGHQVMMMREIYSRCATTLVCLSTGNEKRAATTYVGFDQQPRPFSETWGSTQAKKKNTGLGWLMKAPHQDSTRLVDVFWKDCYSGGPRPETLASFVAFLQSPWWTRSWVYQEFVCSPKVHFVSGEDGAPWEKISACLTPDPGFWCDVWKSRLKSKDHQDIVRAKNEQLDQQRAQKSAQGGEEEPGRDTNIPSFEEEVEKAVDSLIKNLTAPDVEKSIRTVAAMMHGRSKHDSQVGDLRVLLRHARNFQASDARDKIYAFVGLARDDYGFKPSYSHENTPVHVHSDAARRIAEIDRDLNYVLEQAFVGRRDLGYFLPSWVPDWNCTEDRDILLELQNHTDVASESLRASDIDSSLAIEEKVPDPQEVKDKGFILRVTGRCVATLARGSHEISPNLQQFETDSGLVVSAPSTARPKDEIWSLSGCEWPVFLRSEGKDEYCFGGFVVVHRLEKKSTSEKGVRDIFLL
ncbi:Heterokaryon incompatibility protein 6, OR allele [Fusarium oxysporum f. sp. rapae]|uniref:Heterokaryon incompatibility protein 6, OR allele n=1 Tax=Fusarium oxysporum f. sp. rapae TaxID=485398 RepID=A0A8J5P5S5_FUSOX|nr:Heterokaryon incompatibility protein 6, OR allele [Fusarium oxysporum f. sp. rapae]